MSRVVVPGAGLSRRTAASFAKRWLGPNDTVTVISPNSSYNWIPSNIWVGVGLMRPSQVTFPLAPVYQRHGIEFVRAAAREIHPEGDAADPTPYVTVKPTGKSGEGANARSSTTF
jgi:sulfide:quinone oxidoreductase